MKKRYYREQSVRAGESTSHNLVADATLAAASLTGKVTTSTTGATEALQSRTS